MTRSYRPYGILREVLHNLNEHPFSFLGCVGTEDRCTSAYLELLRAGALGGASLVEIVDAESEYSVRAAGRRAANAAIFDANGVGSDAVRVLSLLENEEQIVRWVEDFSANNKRLVLDISSLPKRFFFPAVKLLLRDPTVLDLVVTYSVPSKYHDGNLAERPSDWRALPLFGSQLYPEPKYQLAVVGVGFLPFGLPDLLKTGFKDAKPYLLFPFPASPSTYSKTWEFVRQIEGSLALSSQNQLVQINAMDPSDTFDHIMWLTEQNTKPALFAPYGPKPMSLGMAIFASLTGSPVFYTQPRVYHPDYSAGVKMNDGVPVVHAYSIKLDGRSLYEV